MAGIYVHIPFCRTACTYCDFHFSTSLKGVDALVDALAREIRMSPESHRALQIHTLYWGGGTPSLLTSAQMNRIWDALREVFNLSHMQEFTIEVNPEDVTPERLSVWQNLGVNRVSMGIQTFQIELLEWMNRPHRPSDIHRSLHLLAHSSIQNWSADLMFALPGQTLAQLEDDLAQFTTYPIRHISAYGLTLESGTVYAHQVRKSLISEPDEEVFRQHYSRVMDGLADAGFEQYELSNYAKPGARSIHNSAYWKGLPYLGFGPSAHRFVDGMRAQNVSNNAEYIRIVNRGDDPSMVEDFRQVDRLNEFILTQLRRVEGVPLSEVAALFGARAEQGLRVSARKFVEKGLFWFRDDAFGLTREGVFLADALAAELFFDPNFFGNS